MQQHCVCGCVSLCVCALCVGVCACASVCEGSLCVCVCQCYAVGRQEGCTLCGLTNTGFSHFKVYRCVKNTTKAQGPIRGLHGATRQGNPQGKPQGDHSGTVCETVLHLQHTVNVVEHCTQSVVF